ncbi:sensor histidine kinase [Streptomyces inusitatus]|uniref:sensor histidine kinase n=1 Tax=Streptomyces inusitatus TaxID=68221 RepID=UPI00167C9266|nr:sensor histidine kinase [Streptomyces inusitatus]
MRKTVRQAWKASLHLLTGAGVSLLCHLMVGVVLFTAVLTATVIGAGVLPEAVLTLRRLAGLERRRTAAWTGEPVPEAYEPLTGTLTERVRAAVGDPGTHRDLIWGAAQLLYGMVLLYAAMILWAPALLVDGFWYGMAGREPVALPLITRLADLQARLSRTLLLPSPRARLAERIEQLTVTRADAVAAQGAELRRIERDLHDGAQAHLVALSMRLGLARRAYDKDPTTALRLLEQAQDQAESALTELRHVVRGIHPPILTDRGLAGAVRALAAGSGLDVTVDTGGAEDGPRAPAAVEAAAYFVVAETLTNAAKHSGSDRAEVRLRRGPGRLWISVRDEGRGGATESGAGAKTGSAGGGSGMLGMRRRVAALDGTVQVTSPSGGPTVIEVELPCAW